MTEGHDKDDRYETAIRELLSAVRKLKNPDGNGLDLSHLEDVPAETRERLMYVIQHMPVNGRMQAAGYTKEDALLYILIEAMKASGRKNGYTEEDSEWYENAKHVLTGTD